MAVAEPDCNNTLLTSGGLVKLVNAQNGDESRTLWLPARPRTARRIEIVPHLMQDIRWWVDANRKTALKGLDLIETVMRDRIVDGTHASSVLYSLHE